MLKPSRAVILDEATAYADPQSEAQIQEAVGRLVQGKTLIVVAHRLSTIQNADQILVVDKGYIAASGTQKELLDSCLFIAECGKIIWERRVREGIERRSEPYADDDQKNFKDFRSVQREKLKLGNLL